MPGKRTDKNIIQLIYYNFHKGKSAKQLAEMFRVQLRTVYNIINRAEKEERLELKNSTGRKQKVLRRHEKIIIRSVDNNPHMSTRMLAKQLKNDCNLNVSHETVRKVLLKHKYSSRIARKKPLLSSTNIEKRVNFATSYI